MKGLVTALAIVLTATGAQAHHVHSLHTRTHRHSLGHHIHSVSGDPRPSAWCSWWLRQKLGVAMGAINNLAISWLHYGHATAPHEGAIVIWSRGHGHGHVGQITGGQCGPGRWIVTSGNDGHAVRTRCRYVGNAVGFRE